MNPYASYLMFTFLYIWLLAVGLLGLVICKYPPATREVMYLAILFIIHKRDINIFIKCTSDTATHTCVWQQVYGIIEKEHSERH